MLHCMCLIIFLSSFTLTVWILRQWGRRHSIWDRSLPFEYIARMESHHYMAILILASTFFLLHCIYLIIFYCVHIGVGTHLPWHVCAVVKGQLLGFILPFLRVGLEPRSSGLAAGAFSQRVISPDFHFLAYCRVTILSSMLSILLHNF